MVAGPCVDGGRPTGTSPSSGGLRVAVRSAEAPPDLLAEADLVVECPPGLGELLRWLAA
jgi:hypothetical protein